MREMLGVVWSQAGHEALEHAEAEADVQAENASIGDRAKRLCERATGW